MSQPQGPTSVKSDRVRALRRLSQRSFRQQVRRFLVEGPQGVREAVAHRPEAVTEIYLAEAATEAAQEVAAAASAADIAVITVPEPVLLAMTETVHPQGIAAVCSYIDVTTDQVLGQGRLVVLLDRVRDPGNAGTVLRAADAAGADGVVFSDASVDVYNGKCVRSSAGSIFHLPVNSGAVVDAVVADARARGFTVLAADGAGDLALHDAGPVLAQPTLWLFGNEAHGLGEAVAAAADHRVAVPIYGKAESLNLATAAAVCLYASAAAQRR